MIWLKSLLSDYAAITASLSALGLGIFNFLAHWIDNRQKSKLEISQRREFDKIEMASAQEKEQFAAARQYEIDKLGQIRIAIATVNKLRDGLRKIISNNGVSAYIGSKTVIGEFSDFSLTIEEIFGSPVIQLGGPSIVTTVHEAKRIAQSASVTINRVAHAHEQFPTLDETIIKALSEDFDRLAIIRDKLNDAFLSDVLPLVQAYRHLIRDGDLPK